MKIEQCMKETKSMSKGACSTGDKNIPAFMIERIGVSTLLNLLNSLLKRLKILALNYSKNGRN